MSLLLVFFFFFFQAEDGIRDKLVTGVQTCALPISPGCRPPRCRSAASTRCSRSRRSPSGSTTSSWRAGRASGDERDLFPGPMSRGYLLVRVDGKAYGLPLARVLEVGDLAEVLDVPRALPAMRGLTPLRGRLVPVVHLGALLGERTPPPERGRATVLVTLGAGGGPRAAAEGARFPRRRVALSGHRRAPGGSPQAAQRAGAAPRGHPHRDPRVGGRQARGDRGRGHRGAAGRGSGDHLAPRDREGPGRRIHHRPRREGRADHHCAQHRAAAYVEREARARGGGSGAGEGVMVHSPLPALRSEYEEIARRLESVTGGAEREAVKREIIAYFKQVDSLIGELSALKEEVRKLVDRFKQVSASTAEASAPEFTGTRPAVHADHIGASTFNEKGWSLISLGDYAGAIQALHKALQLSPGETQAESLLGWAQMLHEDYDDALGTFQKVLMKEPANSLAPINVGYICLN